MKKKGFTLVELLAVIVILAIILVIAVPQITKVIKQTRMNALASTAKLICSKAEEKEVENQVLEITEAMTCSELVKLDDNYNASTCTVTKNAQDKWEVFIEGAAGKKFEGMSATGTKDNIVVTDNGSSSNSDSESSSLTCEEGEYLDNDSCTACPTGYTSPAGATSLSACYVPAEQILESACTGTCLASGTTQGIPIASGDYKGLFQDNYGNYRYAGSNANVNNYVTFNGETPQNDGTGGWRIIGVFNMPILDSNDNPTEQTESRIKLIRNDSLGDYSWDTCENTINLGSGINEWSQADLMYELNGDYLDTTLTENPTWYNEINNRKDAEFDIAKVLSTSAQNLIDDAIWYLGTGTGSAATSSVPSPQYGVTAMYDAERGNGTGKVCPQSDRCNDSVTRTTRWVGKVGLVYLSDYGYASSGCKDDNTKIIGYDTSIGYNIDACKNTNWLFNGATQLTITPKPSSGSYSGASNVRMIYSGGSGTDGNARSPVSVRPVVFLKSNVKVTGSGTIADPYEFSL